MFRLAAAVLIVAVLCSPVVAQQPVVQPYAYGLGFRASPYGYTWQQTRVPLPTYSGYGRYLVPQTQYQIYPSPYGFYYQYQTPSIFQGNGSYYIPYSGD